MRSNYKLLGNYIREVNERNKELEDIILLGVSIQKEFIPSIANTIGTDMSTYKIVKRNEFAYGPVTSRNGDKISVALLDTYDEALISQSYKSFEIIDENELIPEYLMMWFRRPEFDRYARYMSHGSTRETFDWVEMCNTELPIPTIEKQREIVKEYKVLQDRISLNNTLIEKLEECTKAVYKKYFYEVEAEYDEITFGEVVVPKKGKTITREKTVDGVYPVVAGGIGPSCYHNKYNTSKPVVTISASGANAGYVNLYHSEVWASDSSFIDTQIFKEIYFCYVFLKINQEKIMSMQIGTGQPHIYPEQLMTLEIKRYPQQLIIEFNNNVSPMFDRIALCDKENKKLKEIAELLLSKLTTVEG